MASPFVLKAIDTYAKLYQWIYRIAVEWDAKQQKIFSVTKKKTLAKWNILRVTVIFGVICCFLVTLMPLYMKTKDELQIWKIVVIATLALMGGLASVCAYELSTYSREFVFVWNSTLRLKNSIVQSKS